MRDKMVQLYISLPWDVYERMGALGMSTNRKWPSDVIPDMRPNTSLGVRRAIALAEPYIDEAIAKYKAAYAARAAARLVWLRDAGNRHDRWCKRYAKKHGYDNWREVLEEFPNPHA